MKRNNKLWLVLGVIALAGCAQKKPPTNLITSAEVTVREVESPDSMQTAPLEVKKAREHLDEAKKEMSNKNYTLARRLAEKSLVEAQLAQAKTEAAKTKKITEDAATGIRTLRQETDRKVSP